MNKTLGQVGYEALRDTRRIRDLHKRGQVFSLDAPREYSEAEEWERQTAEFRSDWEQAAQEVAIEYMQRRLEPH